MEAVPESCQAVIYLRMLMLQDTFMQSVKRSNTLPANLE